MKKLCTKIGKKQERIQDGLQTIIAIDLEEKHIELKNEEKKVENEILEDVKEIFNKSELSEDQKAKAVVKVVASKSEIYSGPIPHPDHLRQYDEISPGCAKLIIQMFVEQSEHRRGLDEKILDAEIKGYSRGQIFGFIILLICLIGGFILVWFDKNGAGMAAIIAAVAGFALSYFHGKKQFFR